MLGTGVSKVNTTITIYFWKWHVVPKFPTQKINIMKIVSDPGAVGGTKT